MTQIVVFFTLGVAIACLAYTMVLIVLDHVKERKRNAER